jgi:hypothetical protein
MGEARLSGPHTAVQQLGGHQLSCLPPCVGAEWLALATVLPARAVATTSSAVSFFIDVTRVIRFTSSLVLRASVEGAANATVMAGQRVSNDVRFTVDHLALT